MVGGLAVFHPDRLTDQLELFAQPHGRHRRGRIAMLGLRRHRGGLRPGARHRLGTARRASAWFGRSRGGAARLRADGGDRPDGGAGCDRPPRPRHGARRGIRRGAGAGVVSAYNPAWFSDTMRWIIACAARSSPGRRRPRCSASRATSTRSPSTGRSRAGSESWAPAIHALRRDSGRRADHVRPRRPDRRQLLAGIYAFGAMLAMTIAHLSIMRLRVTEPDRRRPFRIPTTSPSAGQAPAAGRRGCVLQRPRVGERGAYHDPARCLGGGWMLFGVVFYVVYRRVVEGRLSRVASR